MSRLAPQAVTSYQANYHGRLDQVGRVRAAIARHLGDCLVKSDAVLIASELAANAILHSQSAGEFFTVRMETYPTYVWIECVDLGGPWHFGPPDDRPHGLDLVEALPGPDNWGIEVTDDGDRVVWVRLEFLERRSGSRQAASW